MTIRTAALLALAAGAAMGQPNNMGKVAYVEGRVLILRYGSKTPERAELGTTLFAGDQVKTINGKCQLNMTAGILRMSPNTTLLLPTKARENPYDPHVMMKLLAKRGVSNLRQIVGLEPDEVFRVRDPSDVSDVWDPPSPVYSARQQSGDEQRRGAERGQILARRPGGSSEEEIVAEYRSLLPTVLNAERKPWHTRFEFIANAVKTGGGYRVAYKTYCLIENGPDAGKDYGCYEFDSVLDLATIKTAVTDMKRRLGR